MTQVLNIRRSAAGTSLIMFIAGQAGTLSWSWAIGLAGVLAVIGVLRLAVERKAGPDLRGIAMKPRLLICLVLMTLAAALLSGLEPLVRLLLGAGAAVLLYRIALRDGEKQIQRYVEDVESDPAFIAVN
ncbi:hypothetical protein CQ010_03980 [Arthrobacter sp. MYb211]|uniref:hypothetical protein n=1 Tax=Micrococcaceae TaxID=1268 RepID=UPI000CFCECDB|nr:MULTISPECIES: hypothetical protein [unclassified Arthrobacter]PRA12531.1 hypothetical protein CQ015_04550 [Arthrobacter sp. MYb221]PRC09948.1 hypothetical protein CQ010_03980 [Arthrobacter sp. MYb211]